MSENLKEAIFERLKHSLQLLAAPVAVQLQILPAYVCRTDELALEFDHWREVIVWTYNRDLSPDQMAAISAIKEKLHWLTLERKDLWTDEALGVSSEWQIVRSLAINALRTFSWPVETPPSYEHEYVSPAQLKNHRDN